MKKHIIVIGGGMAGTSAAYHLKKKGYDVTILEKNDRLGGRIHSITTDDAIFEVGAGFISDFYTNVLTFINETGLNKYLQTRKSRSALVKKNTLHSVFSPATLFGNALIPSSAKMRLFKEFLKVFPSWRYLDIHAIWKAFPLDKKSVSQALQEKKDSDLIDYLIQPFLDGYCYWDADTISEAMLLAIFKAALTRRHTYILSCGLQRIPETAAKGTSILLEHEVIQVSKRIQGRYEIVVKNNGKKSKLTADGIVCATTASVVLDCVKDLNTLQKAFFSSIYYSSTAVVATTYHPLIIPKNYAIGYPRKESSSLGAITIVSDIGINKNRKVTLVKLYATGIRGKKLIEENDDVIDKELLAGADLSLSLFDSQQNKAIFRHVQRWQEAIPEFRVGYFKRLYEFARNSREFSDPIVFAGDYLGGPFIEGAFTSGKQAAERLDHLLI